MIKGFLIDYGGGYNEAVDTPEDLKRIYRDYLNDHYKNPYLTKRQVEQAENILADYEAIFYEAESIGPLWDYETFDNTFGFIDADEKAERLRHRDKLKALGENTIKITEQAKKQGLKDYEELKDLIKDKSYSQVLDLCFDLQDCEVFNLDNKSFDFNYKITSGTITKEKGLIDVFDIWYNDYIYSFRYQDLKEDIEKMLLENTADSKAYKLGKSIGHDTIKYGISFEIDRIDDHEVKTALRETGIDITYNNIQDFKDGFWDKINNRSFTENTNYHEPYDESNLDYLQSELRDEVQRLEDLLIYGANGVYEGREYKGYERDDFTKAELDMLVIPYEVDFDADGYPIIRYRRA